MADQWTGGQASSGERWNVNLPAIVGVVFVFLLGVVIWVIASSGGDGDAIESVDSQVTSVPTTVVTTTTAPPATSPQPMPVTAPPSPTTPTATVVASTAPPEATTPPAPTTIAATTTSGPTTSTAPTSSTTPPAGGGDLGVVGHPIQKPACDGSYITVVASAIGGEATAAGFELVLDQYDGSHYLRTDQTCASLTQAVDGQPVYVVYFGPYNVDAEACAARADGPAGAYVRRLSDDLTPSHSVACG